MPCNLLDMQYWSLGKGKGRGKIMRGSTLARQGKHSARHVQALEAPPPGELEEQTQGR